MHDTGPLVLNPLLRKVPFIYGYPHNRKRLLAKEDDMDTKRQINQFQDTTTHSQSTTAVFDLTINDALFTWYRTRHRDANGHHTHEDFFNLDVKFPQDDKVYETLDNVVKSGGVSLGDALFPKSYGPCAPLIYCIGHAACLFRYSNEFCLEDPLPGQRKALKIRFSCQPFDTFNTASNKFKDELDKFLKFNHQFNGKPSTPMAV